MSLDGQVTGVGAPRSRRRNQDEQHHHRREYGRLANAPDPHRSLDGPMIPRPTPTSQFTGADPNMRPRILVH
jgi:hypothetical protein